MQDLNKQALELHRKHKGKLETKSKIKFDSAEVLALTYTPGVQKCRDKLQITRNLRVNTQ
jgi:malic enzyme